MKTNNKPTIVISAFPACGKSHMFKNFNGKPFNMIDSDSSVYSWVYKNGVKTDKRNPNFIKDYMQHIKDNIGKVDIIFVSSHSEVRKALRDNKIKYFMIYPTVSMKNYFLERMYNRGNTEEFIKFQAENFNKFILEIEQERSLTIAKTPFNGEHRFLPYHEVRIDEYNPFITNELLDYLLDNSMGNISSLWWNY